MQDGTRIISFVIWRVLYKRFYFTLRSTNSVDSLAPIIINFIQVMIKLISRRYILRIPCENVRWETHDLIDDWLINTVSGNKLMPPGTQLLPRPMLTKMAWLGHNDLIHTVHIKVMNDLFRTGMRTGLFSSEALGDATSSAWWRHQMETFSALLAICVGNSPVTGEFPTQRPVTRSFDAFFDLRPNERLRKQSWGWWLETLSSPLWRHRNALKPSKFRNG